MNSNYTTFNSTLVILLICASTSRAEWGQAADEYIRLRIGQQAVICSDLNGGCWIAANPVGLRHIDRQGDVTWGDNFLFFEPVINSNPKIVPADTSSVIVAMQRFEDEDAKIYLNRINSEQELLWGEDGIALDTADIHHSLYGVYPGPVPNTFLIHWSGYVRRLQLINLDGEVLWEESGLSLPDWSVNSRILTTSDNCIIAAHSVELYPRVNPLVEVLKFNADGEQLWQRRYAISAEEPMLRGWGLSVVESDRDGGIGLTDYSSPVGNGRDRLLAVFRHMQGGQVRLIELDSSGEVLRSVDTDLRIPQLLDYWPGQGWLYFDHPPHTDYWRATLLDDNLNISWTRELDYQGSDYRSNYPDRVAFQDTTAVVYWHNRDARMIRSEIGASSTTLRSDTLYFFSDEFIDWGTNLGGLQLASDGIWWMLIANRQVLQRLTNDGERLWGDEGFNFTDDIFQARLITDSEGGAWVIWEVGYVIKVIHFNSEGEIVNQNYPENGLDIFDHGKMQMVTAAIDPDSDNIWVFAELNGHSRAATASKELWVQLVGENVVGVPSVDPNLVIEYSLSPAFPNPFNSTTTINYSIPRASGVSIGIYDVSGRLIRDLISEKVTAGNHAIVWDASGYATGIYFCRMQSASFVETTKLVLMK